MLDAFVKWLADQFQKFANPEWAAERQQLQAAVEAERKQAEQNSISFNRMRQSFLDSQTARAVLEQQVMELQQDLAAREKAYRELNLQYEKERDKISGLPDSVVLRAPL